MTATTIAAWIFTALSIAFMGFQFAVAAGAPLGPYVWGGKHRGVLPPKLRRSSFVAAFVFISLILIILDRAGILNTMPDLLSTVGTWVVAALLAVNTVANALSPSKKERNVMTPLAAVLAICAIVVGLQL